MERSGVALIANESEAVVFKEREWSPARLNRPSRSGGLDFLVLFDQAKRTYPTATHPPTHPLY